MTEYILRSYIRKMAMFEMAYTMETETDAAVVLRLIEDAPAADVAPVVRCKDCKYYKPDEYEFGCGCDGGLVYVKANDDFCSYGERRAGK